MSDINRVTIPYGSHSTSNKLKNLCKKTIRIAVKLPQSNEDTCPEFNYKDEVDAAKKRSSVKNTENGKVLDMFADDDDGDVRRIAMEMEEKYGKGMVVPKKRRKGRKDDYADIGMGYDESDSFIDNTDGYDEIIPQNVTTLHGGFYINCGALEFKTDDEESMDSSSASSGTESHSSSRNGKRTLDSDESDNESNENHQAKKPKSESSFNGMQKALKKKLFNTNKILKKKRSSNVLKKTVKDLLKEKRKDLNLSVQDKVENDLDKPVLIEGNSNKNMENGKSSVNDVIESVVKASDEPKLKDRLSSQSTDEVIPVQLPENLPNNISDVINKIKQAASTITNTDKLTDEINILLLSLERKSKCLGKPSKIKVYEHLSHFLKIEKQILMKHCNQLALKDEEKKISSLLLKLKAEIDRIMPSIITNYEKECELVLEKRSILQQTQDGGDEKRKSIGRPKRKFQWNDQTKKLLKDTATIMKRSYLQQGNPKESWEEELTKFLKNNFIQLWPEGWMTMTSLTKVCNKLFTDSKTVNSAPSNITKKEIKNTAPNNPILSYPSLSITPVTTSNVSNKINSKSCSNENNKTEKINSKDNLHHKEKNKSEEVDKKNNNGNTFYKIDYEKPQVASSSSKPKELLTVKEEIKTENIEVINLDDTNNFNNILPNNKLKYDFDFPNCSNTFKNASSEINNYIKEEPVVIDLEKHNSNEENHRNLSESDDIQTVMERLKNLQKMSSPLKQLEGSNSGLSQKSVLKNNIDLVTPSFQNEFQKQLYSALGNLTSNSSKSNYKCS